MFGIKFKNQIKQCFILKRKWTFQFYHVSISDSLIGSLIIKKCCHCFRFKKKISN